MTRDPIQKREFADPTEALQAVLELYPENLRDDPTRPPAPGPIGGFHPEVIALIEGARRVLHAGTSQESHSRSFSLEEAETRLQNEIAVEGRISHPPSADLFASVLRTLSRKMKARGAPLYMTEKITPLINELADLVGRIEKAVSTPRSS